MIGPLQVWPLHSAVVPGVVLIVLSVVGVIVWAWLDKKSDR